MKNKRNKILAFGIILSMLFMTVALPSHAEIVNSGTCGENLTWTLDDEGTLTISGTGDMTNWTTSSYPSWRRSWSSINTVVINSGVTSIGQDAFASCSNLTSITIPDSVTSIGQDAFEDCRSLTSITIPDSVTSIGQGAFRYCTLTNVEIPDSVIYIGKGAFYGCGLTSITLPFVGENINSTENFSHIFSERYYYNGYYKTDTSVPSTLTTVNLTKATQIPNYAFSNYSSLTSIIIPDSVTNIGYSAFSGCSNLTSITIPDSVTYIGQGAFASCNSLTSITIPDSVTSIGQNAFSNCNSLTSITLPFVGENINSAEGLKYVFNYYAANPVPSTLTTVNLTKATQIPDYAFSGCSMLTSITIPDSVTSIGECAFKGCISLTSINVSENNQKYLSQNGVLFNNDKTMVVCHPAGNKESAYTIPDSVIDICDYAFESCSSLTSITIPDSVTNIKGNAFSDCGNLTDVHYCGTAEDWDGILKGDGNEQLINARRHYIPSVKVTQDDSDFTVMPKNIAVRHDIIFATYKNGNLVKLEKKEYMGLAEEFTITDDYDTIKVMLWKKLNGMKPLASAALLKK